MYFAIVLSKIKRGIKEIANGNIGYKTGTRLMFWDAKKATEQLDNIGQTVVAAVDERMKSERMKAELITNVSHDIKTPLTSIINYSDLLGREQLGNEKAEEYVGIISKHAGRERTDVCCA